MKSERLSCGRVDDFPDVDPHTHAELLELIHECYVHATVDVFEQLRHFRGRRSRHPDDLSENRVVHGTGEFASLRIKPAYYLGYVLPRHAGVAGIFALG